MLPSKNFSGLFSSALLTALAFASPRAADIVTVAPAGNSVERYHPLIVDITVTKTFTNGYDPDEIAVDLELTGPNQEKIVQPCFYKADQGGNSVFEGRFAPRSQGGYNYIVAVTDKSGRKTSTSYTLTSVATTGNGFLHIDSGASNLYAFKFDSGKPWRGIGEDVAWEPGGYTYAKVLPRLAGLGCNMIRIWHCPWHMPIEWNSAPNIYNKNSSDYMDQLVNLAEQNGIYMMVMMNDYREFSEQWSSSPYSTGKGGWCASAKEFFTNASAKACYKKKLRYYIARWGYSPSIQSWEFFNEIDNAMGSTGIDPNALSTWTDEMSAYFHSIDPYGHMVTSSVSWVYENFWAAKGIDFTQSHLYGPSNKISKLPSETKRYEDGFKKPYVCGEFSRRWESATAEPSINYRIDLHYGMWEGIFTPNPIVPMTWWWDSHFNWGDDFVFKSAAGFSNDVVAKAAGNVLIKMDATATANQQVGAIKTGNTGYVWVSNYAGTGAANNVSINITGLPAGNTNYTVEWYDTQNGGFASATPVTAQNGNIILDAGTLAAGADKAARITSLGGAITEIGPAVARVPSRISWLRNGRNLTLFADFAPDEPVDAALFDMGGRMVASARSGDFRSGRLDMVTGELPGRMYVLKVRSGARMEALKVAF